MPTSPKTPCRYPGCPKLTHERYCPEHQKQVDSQYNRYQRDLDTQKRYGTAWKKIRVQYLLAHPLCELCKEEGRLTPTQEVHHILPLRDGGTHDDENLMSLCKACHSSITAKEGGRWG